MEQCKGKLQEVVSCVHQCKFDPAINNKHYIMHNIGTVIPLTRKFQNAKEELPICVSIEPDGNDEDVQGTAALSRNL